MTKIDKSYLDRIRKIHSRVGCVMQTVDFITSGIKSHEITLMCDAGFIERIRHGFYRLCDNDFINDEVLISKILPHAIVNVESALFHYGYSDFTPRQWTLAVSRNSYRVVSKIDAFPVKAYYVNERYLCLGKTIGDFNGVKLPVYDRERTICDCFKYRSKLDTEVFAKAVKSYSKDKKKNIINLIEYSKVMKLNTKVMNLMEVILND